MYSWPMWSLGHWRIALHFLQTLRRSETSKLFLATLIFRFRSFWGFRNHILRGWTTALAWLSSMNAKVVRKLVRCYCFKLDSTAFLNFGLRITLAKIWIILQRKNDSSLIFGTKILELCGFACSALIRRMNLIANISPHCHVAVCPKFGCYGNLTDKMILLTLWKFPSISPLLHQ